MHQAYIEAGAQIIETNTFGANRFKLAPLGLAEDVQRLNSRGVKIAREARESAAREVLIAGSIGPLGIGVQARHPEPDQILAVFHEQALALEERGVDLFILETFSYIEELLLAIDAIRSFSGSADRCAADLLRRRHDLWRSAPVAAASMLQEKNVQVDRRELHAGSAVASADSPRACQRRRMCASAACPTPAFPKREGDRIVYPKSSPEYFAEFAREAAANGRAHSRRMLRHDSGTHSRDGRGCKVPAACAISCDSCGDRPRATRAGRSSNASLRASSGENCRRKNLSSASRSIRPKGISLERIYEQVDKVMASKKVDAIDINSGAMARVGMDALIVAGALEARGIETVPHLTTRDQNIIGLQAMLLGAWAVGGVRNVLGDHRRSAVRRRLSGNERRLRSGFRWAYQDSASPESGHGLGRQNAWWRRRTSRSAWP